LAVGLRSLNLFSQTFIFLTTHYSFFAEQLLTGMKVTRDR
jgi:hypothetical protein